MVFVPGIYCIKKKVTLKLSHLKHGPYFACKSVTQAELSKIFSDPLKEQSGSGAGGQDHLQALSLPCLVADAGCWLGPQPGVWLEHLQVALPRGSLASSHHGGQAPRASIMRQSQGEAVLPFSLSLASPPVISIAFYSLEASQYTQPIFKGREISFYLFMRRLSENLQTCFKTGQVFKNIF